MKVISLTCPHLRRYNQYALPQIISYASQKIDRTLTIAEIKKLGSTAQGNHNKLYYEPWALLEVVDKNTRNITEKLIQFHNNEITLPFEIIVFSNGESVAKTDTKQVLFSDL